MRTPKRYRNHSERASITPKHREDIPNGEGGSAKSHSEERRKTGEANPAKTSRFARNIQKEFRGPTSRYREEITGTLRAIRKRFGHTPRTFFGVISGSLQAVRDVAQVRKPVSF
jgi:hypothetical protein